MSNQSKLVQKMVFAAFYAALAVVFMAFNTMVPIFEMPNGGSLELFVIAIILASFHLGWKWGVGVGLIAWVLGMMFGYNKYIRRDTK